MKLTNFITIIILLLSTVVLVTDSCSSFTGWKMRSNKRVDPPLIIQTTTIKQNDMTTETTTMKTDSIAADDLAALDTVIDDESCPEEFAKVFCYNDGECYVKRTNDKKEMFCACKHPYEGPRCMQKSIDDFDTKTHLKQQNEGVNNKANMIDTNDKPVLQRDFTKEPIYKNDRKDCPSPLDKDLCGDFGRCFMFTFSDVDFFCECIEPYYGQRCENKGTHGYYGNGMKTNHSLYPNENRKRRHVPFYTTRRNLGRMNAKA